MLIQGKEASWRVWGNVSWINERGMRELGLVCQSAFDGFSPHLAKFLIELDSWCDVRTRMGPAEVKVKTFNLDNDSCWRAKLKIDALHLHLPPIHLIKLPTTHSNLISFLRPILSSFQSRNWKDWPSPRSSRFPPQAPNSRSPFHKSMELPLLSTNTK